MVGKDRFPLSITDTNGEIPKEAKTQLNRSPLSNRSPVPINDCNRHYRGVVWASFSAA